MKLSMKFLISVREIRREISLLKKLKLKRQEWVRKKFKNEKELRLEKVEKEDGTVVIDVMTAMIHQRYTISEI